MMLMDRLHFCCHCFTLIDLLYLSPDKLAQYQKDAHRFIATNEIDMKRYTANRSLDHTLGSSLSTLFLYTRYDVLSSFPFLFV